MFRDLPTIGINYFDDQNIDYFRIKNIESEELKKIIKKYTFNGLDIL